LQEAIRRQVPHVPIECIYFENAPDKCERNIRRRARREINNDLEALKRFAPVYRIPEGVTPLPVREGT
jgi:hypothetical protein